MHADDTVLAELRLKEDILVVHGVLAALVLNELRVRRFVLHKLHLSHLRAGERQLRRRKERRRVRVARKLLVGVTADHVDHENGDHHRYYRQNDDKLHQGETFFSLESVKVLYHAIFRLS